MALKLALSEKLDAVNAGVVCVLATKASTSS